MTHAEFCNTPLKFIRLDISWCPTCGMLKDDNEMKYPLLAAERLARQLAFGDRPVTTLPIKDQERLLGYLKERRET